MSLIEGDIKEVLNALMSEGLSKKEAAKELMNMRNRVLEGEDPEDLLYEIGLEPDYVFALI